MTINLTVTSTTLCDLLGGAFTYDACEAICEYLNECGCDDPLTIGDISISFSEIPQDWVEDEDSDRVIKILDNGNALILQ